MKIILLATALVSTFSLAGSVTSKLVKTESFKPTDSEKLKKFKIKVSDYKVILSDGKFNLGTKMHAIYETTSPEYLREYVIVQYIKGCRFQYLEKDGQGHIAEGIVREFFDEIVPFKHTNWVIDSVDMDPVYNSHEQDRHGLYRWNTVKDSTHHSTENYFYEATPPHNQLYIRDMPSTAFYEHYPELNGFYSSNTSLKFKTCILKTEDVPTMVESPGTDLSQKAIKCFEWDSSFIFNPKTREYEKHEEIHPVCN